MSSNQNKPKINLLTVDDNQLQIEGFAKLCATCDFINYRGNVNSPEACIDRVIKDRFLNMLLMDVNFPRSNMDGIDLVYKLRELQPFEIKDGKPTAPRIIFFSVEDKGFTDAEMGVHGLISKNASFDRLITLVQLVHEQGIEIPLPPIKQKNDDENHSFLRVYERLTPKEKKVFILVLKRKTTKEIAQQFGRAKTTINVHRRRIIEKLREEGFDVKRIDDNSIYDLARKNKYI